jgi:hypothetical protein
MASTGSPALTPRIRESASNRPRMVMVVNVCFDGLAVRRAVRLEAIPIISFRLLCLLVGEKLFGLKPHNNIKVLLSEGPEIEIRPKGQSKEFLISALWWRSRKTENANIILWKINL